MILLVNACVRREKSRTRRLAQIFLPNEFSEVVLEQENLRPLDSAGLEQRNRLLDEGRLDDPLFRYAHQFSQADLIVIAAPYWDLAFPALLKCYLEAITVNGITFKYDQEGRPLGLCQAQKLIYVTTSGGYIGEFNLGYTYIQALAAMLGISKTEFAGAEGLDIWGNDPETILQQAILKYIK